MNDKSPRQQLSKKSVKSIKQKRADRRDKQSDQPAVIIPSHKSKSAR
jgi:hypothetical protein